VFIYPLGVNRVKGLGLTLTPLCAASAAVFGGGVPCGGKHRVNPIIITVG